MSNDINNNCEAELKEVKRVLAEAYRAYGGFADAVRTETGLAYPYPAIDNIEPLIKDILGVNGWEQAASPSSTEDSSDEGVGGIEPGTTAEIALDPTAQEGDVVQTVIGQVTDGKIVQQDDAGTYFIGDDGERHSVQYGESELRETSVHTEANEIKRFAGETPKDIEDAFTISGSAQESLKGTETSQTVEDSGKEPKPLDLGYENDAPAEPSLVEQQMNGEELTPEAIVDQVGHYHPHSGIAPTTQTNGEHASVHHDPNLMVDQAQQPLRPYDHAQDTLVTQDDEITTAETQNVQWASTEDVSEGDYIQDIVSYTMGGQPLVVERNDAGSMFITDENQNVIPLEAFQVERDGRSVYLGFVKADPNRQSLTHVPWARVSNIRAGDLVRTDRRITGEDREYMVFADENKALYINQDGEKVFLSSFKHTELGVEWYLGLHPSTREVTAG